MFKTFSKTFFDKLVFKKCSNSASGLAKEAPLDAEVAVRQRAIATDVIQPQLCSGGLA